MPGISIGSVSISVVPAATGFTDKLRATLIPEADALGADIGQHIADGINAALHDISVNVTAHLDTAEADAALDELARKTVSPTVSLDDTRIVAALEDLGIRLDELNDEVTNVRLTLEDGDIGAKLDDISLKLDDIGTKDVNPKVGLDDESFNRQIDEDKAKLDALNASSASGVGGPGTGALIGGAIAGGLAASPALPGALTGAGAAVGTLGLAFAGIDPVLQDYSAKQSAAATATGKTGSAAISAASQIHSAQQAVSAAQTTAAHDVITSAQAQVTAEQALQSAEYTEQQAQVSLTLARQQAVLTLQSLNNASADAVLNAQQAKLSLEQAQLTQQQTDASSTATALQKQQADLNVALAEQHLKESLEARTNSAKAAATADKAGVDGSPAVLAAQHNLAVAHQAVATAQTNAANVSRNAAWQEQADATSVSNAQYSLKAAYASAATSSGAASSAAKTYAAALAALTPAGKAMVGQIIGLEAGLKTLEGISETAIAPGFTAFLKGVHALMPLISGEVTAMGGIIGQGLAAAGKAFESSGFQKTLKTLFDQGNQFLQIIGPAIGGFLRAFGDAGAKSTPAVLGLANGLAAIVTGLGNLVTNLAPFAGAIGSVLASLGGAVEALGGPLGTVLGDLMTLLAPLLASALPLFKALLGDIVKVVDPLAKALLPVLAGVLAAIGPSLGQVAALLGQFAAASVQVLIALLPLLPPLVKLTVAFLPVLLQQFQLMIPVIKAVAPLLAALATALVPVVTWIANVVTAGVNWITNLTSLETVMVAVAAFFISAWNTIYSSVTGVINNLIGFYKTSWDTVSNGVKDAYSAISSFITGSWDQTYSQVSGVIGRLISFLALSWDQTLGDVKGAWTGISNWFASWWNTLTSGFKTYVANIRSALSTGWNTIETDFKAVWNNVVTWVTGTLAGAFKSAFQGLLSGISSVWSTLQAIVSKPVDFIINTIYDKGIVPVVNAVGSLIGLTLKPVAGFAGGGKVTEGTTPTADDVLARISKGETVVSEAHSQVLAPAFAAVGVPGYAAGGIPNPVSAVAGGLSDIGKALAGLAGSALGAAAKAVLDPLLSAMPGGGTTLGADLKKIPQAIINDLVARLTGTGAVVGGSSFGNPGNFAPGSLSGAVGNLPANYRAIVSYLVAHGFTKAEAAGIAGNIDAESGGNPNIWEIGGGGGYGLIQWTPPPPGLVGSGLSGELAQIVREGTGMFSNPGSPAAAAYQYLVGRERPADPGATAALREASANAVYKAMGYDSGGWMPPGLSLNMNGTGKPEPVLSGQQWAMLSAATAGGDGSVMPGRQMARKLDRMISLLEQAPGRTAGGLGEQLNGTARSARTAAYFRTR